MAENELYEAVLKKIGRNVLLFQQLELLLKFIIANGQYSGYINEIADIKKERNEKVHKQTMGQLVSQYLESSAPEYKHAPKEPEILKEAYFSFSVSVSIDSETYEQMKHTLTELVNERNELIHHLIPQFDRSSESSCRKLTEQLEQLTEKLRKEISTVNSHIKMMQTSSKKALEFMSSEEGQKQFNLSFLRGSQIVTNLLQYLYHYGQEDGWAPLATAAHFVHQQAADDMKHMRKRHGHKTLKSLMLATELFDIENETTEKGGIRVRYRLKSGFTIAPPEDNESHIRTSTFLPN
ncbi:hypothetical protein G3444_06955 [Shewanella baltica]|uniref:hypothetical protein n=1 Tax=Shewanella baltica TaxID=62322 RepID=UPI00217EB574|nr:hypothetical protein [Shewanella baltica]MCS6095109.1 hypothetical protein [Shewanella baltica]MCS6118649.1 hypothetical protein [Shewanella baltica]MCS6226217.1 hypothetical protein [Shewanella baltica]